MRDLSTLLSPDEFTEEDSSFFFVLGLGREKLFGGCYGYIPLEDLLTLTVFDSFPKQADSDVGLAATYSISIFYSFTGSLASSRTCSFFGSSCFIFYPRSFIPWLILSPQRHSKA